MHADAHRSDPLTEKIIACAYRVQNTLGCGFLEKVYENAMVVELRRAGLTVKQQVAIPVVYEGVVVGDYCADLVVENQVLLELKAVKALDEIHEAQCLNYLAITGFPTCLLFNCAKTRLVVKRFVGRSRLPNPSSASV